MAHGKAQRGREVSPPESMPKEGVSAQSPTTNQHVCTSNLGELRGRLDPGVAPEPADQSAGSTNPEDIDVDHRSAFLMLTEERIGFIAGAADQLLYFLEALDPLFLDWERLGEILNECDGDLLKTKALIAEAFERWQEGE